MSNPGIGDLLVVEAESTAEWRRRKAQQFPDDRRNLQAAEELERLASELKKLVGTAMDQRVISHVERILDKEDADLLVELSTWVSEELRHVGFHQEAGTALEFATAYCDKIEELLIDLEENELDERIAPLVENDPVVKEAKAAYDKAKAAYERAVEEATERIRRDWR